MIPKIPKHIYDYLVMETIFMRLNVDDDREYANKVSNALEFLWNERMTDEERELLNKRTVPPEYVFDVLEHFKADWKIFCER
jgi:nicotinic acid phosphoribosyltransferase